MAKILFVLILNLTIYSLPAYAGRKAPTPQQITDNIVSSSQGKTNSLGLSFGVYGLIGSGKAGNDTDTQLRSVYYSSLGSFLGFKTKNWRLGYNYEYQQITQSESIVAQTNSKISGVSSISGVRLDYLGKWMSFGVVYQLSNDYQLFSLDSNFSVVRYQLVSGYSIQSFIKVFNDFGFIIDYSVQTLKNSTLDNLTQNRLGLGIAYSN